MSWNWVVMHFLRRGSAVIGVPFLHPNTWLMLHNGCNQPLAEMQSLHLQILMICRPNMYSAVHGLRQTFTFNVVILLLPKWRRVPESFKQDLVSRALFQEAGGMSSFRPASKNGDLKGGVMILCFSYSGTLEPVFSFTYIQSDHLMHVLFI